jgi:hypothetical protein
MSDSGGLWMLFAAGAAVAAVLAIGALVGGDLLLAGLGLVLMALNLAQAFVARRRQG